MKVVVYHRHGMGPEDSRGVSCRVFMHAADKSCCEHVNELGCRCTQELGKSQ